MTYLQTERLVLRNLCDTDLPVIFSIRNDPRCAEFQRWDDTSSPAVSALITLRSGDRFPSCSPVQRYGIAFPGGSCIGDLSVFYNKEDRCFTLGISLAQEHQKKGYAFEILSAVVASLRNFAPSEELVALIHPNNTASKRLFEKLGFTLECYAPKIDSEIYSITPGKGE